ncbi:uncharacterized protein BYT42DRAFT_505620 [Radiomyces spectabilis]|uniref:uncharacterized protein n=1 Tax=Radiomyces spectabilis TaxID=64574 RepID=UPI00221FFD06|nr:uncharacterized protein BYT42DRAFT_505620 [Radiomyces spectabilis]KAI8365185.1 hypothetical protein BYT42DRAFT_505620 [Radiomyces spectabilis]
MDINSSSSSPTPHRFILDLNNNVSYQQGAAKYICPYCQKAFTRPSSLRTHTYSHTGEKPFECTEEGCGRKFSVQSNLRRHLRIHRLNRPMSVGYASASSNSSVSK